MSCILDDLFNIDNAVANFHYIDLYNASIAFYESLSYPLKPLHEVVNEEIQNFIFLKAERKVQYSAEELLYLKSINSISILFSLENKIEKLETNYFDKLTFIAIDMDCDIRDRSQYSGYITKIISKAFYNSIFILFKHKNWIMFSGLIPNKSSKKLGQVYLSEWYECVDNNINQLMSIYKLCYTLHNSNSILELYFDMLYSISREYMVYQVLYIEIQNFYGIFYKSYDEFNEKIIDNVSYFKSIYGNDYFDNSDTINILEPEDDYLDLQEVDELPTKEIEENENIKDEKEIAQGLINTIDEVIDEDCFKDPIKMLQWLDKNDSTDKRRK